MDKHSENLSALEDFVQVNGLNKSNGFAKFNCTFTVNTPKYKNIVERSCDTMLTFNNYNNEGVLSILDSKLDPYQFPTSFRAKFNNFRLSGHSLLISDTHPNIGKYNVIVTPTT